MPADNAGLVATFLDELWNKGNLAIVDKLTTVNYVSHIPQGDLPREELKAIASFYFARFTQINVNFTNQTSHDSQVVTRIEWITALNLRVQPSLKEINRNIPVRGVSIDRIENELIAESWNMLDTLYWLYNIQVLSRDPGFVVFLPASRTCPPACPDGQECRGHQCSGGSTK
jgi:hypothetical protein